MQKKIIRTIFCYLKRFYEGVEGFHETYLGTKNIANIFICV